MIDRHYFATLLLISIMLPQIARAALTGSIEEIKFSPDRIDSNVIELAGIIKHKPLLIDFWASWCNRCMAKLETLNQLSEKLGTKFDLIAINAGESDKELSKFWRKIESGRLPHAEQFKQFARHYRQLRDPERALSKDLFKVLELPQILLYDHHGKLIHRFNQDDNLDTIMTVIKNEIP